MEQPELVVLDALHRRHHRRRFGVVALLAGALVLGACSSRGDDDAGEPAATTTAATTTRAGSAATTTAAPTTTVATTTTTAATTLPLDPPAGDAFYQPPDPLPEGSPGDLIWAREIPGVAGGRGWTILYLSRSATDVPIAVSGTVFAPAAVADAGIVAWAHGTTGLGDACAPSRQAAGGEGSEVLLGTAVVSRGMVFVATDYEGLGTPGVHTYLVGQSEGRAVLDSIRATRQLLSLPSTTKAVVWGHSQGGGAALWAAELAETYAPDANVLGTVAGAPAAQFATFAASIGESTSFGFQLMAIAGFKAAYPELPLEEVVTPDGAAAVAAAGEQCLPETFAAVAGQDPSRYFTPGAAESPPWVAALTANDPGAGRTGVPIFLYHGDADDIVPVQVSEAVAASYCANGVTVQRQVYEGADHTNVIVAALPEINAFVDARLAGEPATSTC